MVTRHDDEHIPVGRFSIELLTIYRIYYVNRTVQWRYPRALPPSGTGDKIKIFAAVHNHLILVRSKGNDSDFKPLFKYLRTKTLRKVN